MLFISKGICFMAVGYTATAGLSVSYDHYKILQRLLASKLFKFWPLKEHICQIWTWSIKQQYFSVYRHAGAADMSQKLYHESQ